LIPAGTGGAARDIRQIASDRDAKIVEQKRLEEEKLKESAGEEELAGVSEID